jgi:protein-S-isoprenylcysteine O-methyltransferase Ste14
MDERDRSASPPDSLPPGSTPERIPHVPWWHGSRGEWYVVVQFALFALLAFGPRSWPGAPAWPAGLWAAGTWLGLGLMLAGAPLAVGGLRSLGGDNLTALPHPTETARFVERGPYKIVRHPIYSGLILGAWGWGLYQHSWLVLAYAAALAVLFDLKTRREERWLLERFSEYAQYRERVKKLLPWIY